MTSPISDIKPELVPFANDFNLKEFIEKISGRHVQQVKSNIKSFDPTPFINAFENNIEELTKLKKMVNRKLGDLEDMAQAADTTHKSRITDLNQDYQLMTEAFEKLESRIVEVGNTAILIGEQIESLDKQRLKTQEAKDLVLYFNECNNGNTARLDLLKKSNGWDGKAKAASIAKKLNSIAKEVDLPATEKAQQIIEKYCESIEKEILGEFDQALKDGDVDRMSNCARILFDFNGGQSCIQIFVNQHAFFAPRFNMEDLMPKEEESNESIELELPKTLNDYESVGNNLDPKLIQLYADIEKVVESEWLVISKVFPNYVSVMQLFLHRIFAQWIQNQIENLLKSSKNSSLLIYLQNLSEIHAATVKLVSRLKQISENILKDSSQLNLIGTSLQRCKEDIFILYTDNDRYLDKEMKCVSRATFLLLEPFNEYVNLRKLAAKNVGVFAKLSVAPTMPNEDPLVGFHEELIPKRNVFEKGILIFKEATERCRSLSAITELAKNVQSLFQIFSEQLGKKYLDGCLDLTLSNLLANDPKLEPDLRFLSLVQTINEIVFDIENFFDSVIVPLVSTQPTIHRDLVIKKNEFLSAVESKLNVIIQKILEGIIGWFSGILAKQKKYDYKPKENELAFLATLSTTPCIQACDYIKKIHAQFSKYLEGTNLENVLIEFGNQLHGALLVHLKKFVINTNGGLLLNKDLAKYQETISTFKIQSLNDRFESLRQIGNIYIVKPENLKMVLDEGILSRLDPQVLHALVANRADYKQAKLESLFKGVGFSQDKEPQKEPNKWEKSFEDAVVVMGDTFEEVGESLAKFMGI